MSSFIQSLGCLVFDNGSLFKCPYTYGVHGDNKKMIRFHQTWLKLFLIVCLTDDFGRFFGIGELSWKRRENRSGV